LLDSINFNAEALFLIDNFSKVDNFYIAVKNKIKGFVKIKKGYLLFRQICAQKLSK